MKWLRVFCVDRCLRSTKDRGVVQGSDLDDNHSQIIPVGGQLGSTVRTEPTGAFRSQDEVGVWRAFGKRDASLGHQNNLVWTTAGKNLARAALRFEYRLGCHLIANGATITSAG